MTPQEREALLAEVLCGLANHEGVSFDLGTPREYTQYGGWNERCQCGIPIGDGGSPESTGVRHRRHQGEVLAKSPAFARILDGARAEALEEAADAWRRTWWDARPKRFETWLGNRADRLRRSEP